ncbi:dihydroorotase [Candidatus Poriferisodalis sp.]|uniref:dihydroorotase n=1 Tax=Candidatus Poriferisodalis sp. TaxID=3101277 RepID=UPI003B5CE908
MAADLVISGGRLADSAHGGERVDVIVEAGRISAVVPVGEAPQARRTLDASDAWVMPGFVDIQVHFRTPGGTDSEDIASGAAGAAMGGVTACVMMPNTNPPIDTPGMVQDVLAMATGAPCDVRTSAAITVGRAGERLTDFAALYDTGVRVFTDDGDCVADDALMEAALAATVSLPGAVVSQHAEDPEMVAGGVINAGAVAERMGVQGRPALAEISVVQRDIGLARGTGGRYHVLHLSTAEAMEQVAQAKREGFAVSAEVTPQHLVLTEDDVERLGTTGKMNPPLRLRSDVEALRRAIVDGTLDAVATDHAPHHASLKDTSLRDAAPGMTGVETMASVIWSELVATGAMSPARFVEVVSAAPARIAGIAEHGHRVDVGMPANLAVFDPAQRWTVRADELQSRSRNTPWAGRELTGKVRHTVLAGRPVVSGGELCGSAARG